MRSTFFVVAAVAALQSQGQQLYGEGFETMSLTGSPFSAWTQDDNTSSDEDFCSEADIEMSSELSDPPEVFAACFAPVWAETNNKSRTFDDIMDDCCTTEVVPLKVNSRYRATWGDDGDGISCARRCHMAEQWPEENDAREKVYHDFLECVDGRVPDVFSGQFFCHFGETSAPESWFNDTGDNSSEDDDKDDKDGGDGKVEDDEDKDDENTGDEDKNDGDGNDGTGDDDDGAGDVQEADNDEEDPDDPDSPATRSQTWHKLGVFILCGCTTALIRA